MSKKRKRFVGNQSTTSTTSFFERAQPDFPTTITLHDQKRQKTTSAGGHTSVLENRHKRLKDKYVFIIRHGQSEANVDYAVLKTKADHSIALTPEGIKQAKISASHLMAKLKSIYQHDLNRMPLKVEVWTSPFKRTRQTADAFIDILGQHLIKPQTDFRTDSACIGELRCHENVELIEQLFGLFAGLTKDEIKAQFPREFQYFEKCIQFNGRYFAKMPLGESRSDVARRVGQFMHNELLTRKNQSNVIILISHGLTTRAIKMQLLRRSHEWLEKTVNPLNCAIAFIEKGVDKGFIFEGFQKPPRKVSLLNQPTPPISRHQTTTNDNTNDN
eukprot:CAMPEP_0201563122 /NCGR_PEP_ID=MMETSP0173_2-20130828/79708_1 /ASSEMBLY_ACC=CAM_ASM_000268 /TAXON_ID=218659 /ORGANISM="Vexillifera sp., Strain DIVA3 564/2" /LENGTH=329 /DNA_ID=CAMNT_0047977765 /DNA_START=677 /DNA_END=1663 /DNA_ORIENTATION=-